jgi:homospermidine synthase
MTHFEKRVLFVGFGSVAQCTLPILLKHLNVPHKNITVMDFVDAEPQLKAWIERGVNFVKNKVTEENLHSLLAQYVGDGDILIDLAWNIDCCEILNWCHNHGVMYLNTSVEVWDPYKDAESSHPTKKTLYWRHMNVRRMIAGWTTPGPTAVLEHGANPGLISHFTKQGLIDISQALIEEKKVDREQSELLSSLVKEKKFNHLAMELGVKVIHCSERDTQISNRPKEVDEFVNTWSVEGFREEGTTTAEMGWGTHEKTLPALAVQHPEGPKNQICLAKMGMNTWVRSWVPNYDIHGMVVRHGEAFTISDKLTVWNNDQAIYRPTVHYAYCPSDVAIASLNELRGNNYNLQSRIRIMNDEITAGEDILGALIMGHSYNSWWVGSALSIEESRRLVPHQNATTMQVAISVVAAVLWMIENPQKGVVVPDDLPHDFVLEVSKPYLGRFISTRSDWTPLKQLKNYFGKEFTLDLDLKDPWQFKNFAVQE